MSTANNRTYDAFVTPRTPGIGSFGTVLSLVLFFGSIAGVFLIKIVGVVFGLSFMVVGILAVSFVGLPDEHGRSRLQYVAEKWGWRANKGNKYVSGPFSRLGAWLLPGILAQSTLSEQETSEGRSFGMVHMPKTNHYAVTFECHPDGTSLASPEDVVANVDRWGDWLAFMCGERSAVQAMVTIETTPDLGHTLRRNLQERGAASAPDLTKAVVAELVATHKVGVPNVRSFVTLTFAGDHVTGKRKVEQMAAALAPRLPAIVRKLTATGAGPSRLMTGQQVTEVIRGAYDPGCAVALADAASEGRPVVMRWDSIGPPAADNQWEYYRHASGVSVTWSMSDIRGGVVEETLVPLLRANERVTHKRVSLVYRLRDPKDAPSLAANDVRAAEFSVNTAKKVNSRQTKRQKAASTNADLEAHGQHGLVEIGALVTVTVQDGARPGDDGEPVKVPALTFLPEIDAEVDTLSSGARLALRRNDGTHASSFAQNLPCVGLVASAHSSMPASLQESV